MDRRSFLAASILSTAGRQSEAQMTYPSFGAGESEWLARPQDSLPDLDGASQWLNTDPLSKRSLRGKTVLVNFWTYSCINSLRPLPFLKRWAAQYVDDGLVVLGVHTPEFSFEKQRANVGWALREFQIAFPVAMDNDYRIWRAFRNQYWPAFYVVDRKGTIRFRHFGEGQYFECEREIRMLLKEAGASGSNSPPKPIQGSGIEAPPGTDVQTPETYVGYRRGERFRSPERVGRDQPRIYTQPANLRLNQWGFSGTWEIGAESALLRQPNGKLTFRFHSRDLHLVAGPNDAAKAVRFRVTLDGVAPGSDAGVDTDIEGSGTVWESRLYQLVRQKGEVRDRTFTIEFLDAGARAFSFTFG